MDVFIKADPANAEAVFAALLAFGAPLDDIAVGDLADPRQFISFVSDASRSRSIFSPASTELILTRHGKDGLRESSTPKAV
jgi:hypothetical protein